jgi:hypothetical protein
MNRKHTEREKQCESDPEVSGQGAESEVETGDRVFFFSEKECIEGTGEWNRASVSLKEQNSLHKRCAELIEVSTSLYAQYSCSKLFIACAMNPSKIK